MRCRIFVLVLGIVMLRPFPGAAESLEPLATEDATLLPAGRVEVTLAGRGRLGGRTPFDEAERDEWSAPFLSIRAGLGYRAEAQLSWEALEADFTGRMGGTEYGTGDARLSTKVRVFSEGGLISRYTPATSLHFGLKLPNASRANGLGTDETDVFGLALFSKGFGPGWRGIANLGIGILGNPGRRGGQDDVLLWSVAMVTPPFRHWPDGSARFYLESEGVEAGRFGNERRRAVGGVRLIRGPWAFFFGGGAGLTSESEDVIARFGVLYTADVETN